MSDIAPGFEWHAAGVRLTANLVPWDHEVFGFPVAQVAELRVRDGADPSAAWQRFNAWLTTQDVQVASCRLPMDRLRESMFLEARGFRFIEVVLHPFVKELERLDLPADTLTILRATEDDLPALTGIAEQAFRNERYHIDPRIDPRLGQRRYARWVRTSLGHPSQMLLKINDGERLVGFFVVEERSEQQIYWHLNAIAPALQGQGYGRRAWRAMLRRHRDESVVSVGTTISARNIAVQNIYARLGFGFLAPEMTFHWVRGAA